MKLVIFGSSVAWGACAENDHGWAERLSGVLRHRGWEVVNKSIGGDTTVNLLDRFERDLLSEHPDVAFIAVSMANEGVVEGRERIARQFRANIDRLVELCRTNRIIPVVGSCYPNNAYDADHLALVRAFNTELSASPLASVDFLGCVDDGRGHWSEGTWVDDGHPNDLGHEEMFRAIPSSMFDHLKLRASPLAPPASAWLAHKGGDDAAAPISFAPDHEMHSFTFAFGLRLPEAPAAPSAFAGVNSAWIGCTQSGHICYRSTAGDMVETGVRLEPGVGYHLALAHSYVNRRSRLIVDGEDVGGVDERITPYSFTLAGRSDRAACPSWYRNYLVYRTCLAPDDVRALMYGRSLRSSLDLYAHLSDFQPGNAAWPVNRGATSVRLTADPRAPFRVVGGGG